MRFFLWEILIIYWGFHFKNSGSSKGHGAHCWSHFKFGHRLRVWLGSRRTTGRFPNVFSLLLYCQVFVCSVLYMWNILPFFFFFTWPTPSDSSKFKLPTRMHLTNSSHLSAWPTRLHSVHFPSKDPIFQCLSKRLSPSHYKGSLCFTYESPVPRAEQEPLLGT